VEFPASVLFFAEEHLFSEIKSVASQADLVALSVDAPIPQSSAARANVAVLQVEPGSPASLERLDRLKSEFPDLPVIVGLANVDMKTTRTLLRQGITDIVGLPFDIRELQPILLDVAAKMKASGKNADLAPIISVVKATGGCGGTTVSTHLAYAMKNVQSGHFKTCLIDLDLQHGSAADYLGVQPRLSITELMGAGHRLDDEQFQAVAAEGAGGVDLIAAPTEILPIEAFEFDQLIRVLQLAQKRYDLVLLDLPSNLTNWALSAILASNLVVLVGELGLTSLRQVKRRLDLLVSMGFIRQDVAIVINKAEQRLFKSINVEDAERAIHHKILGTIASDPSLIADAQDQGLLAYDLQKRSKFGKDIDLLANELRERLSR
jgi:pilus assembly protein CpaE